MTATTFFLQTPDRRNNQTLLASVDIVGKPEAKKITNTQKTKQVKAVRKKSYKRKSNDISRKIKISGYRGQSFVYGEVIPLEDGKLQGFIYHPDNSKTYVYGEKVKNKINLYDSSGNLYQMLHEGSIEH